MDEIRQNEMSYTSMAKCLDINYKTFIGKLKRDSLTVEKLFKISDNKGVSL